MEGLYSEHAAACIYLVYVVVLALVVCADMDTTVIDALIATRT